MDRDRPKNASTTAPGLAAECDRTGVSSLRGSLHNFHLAEEFHEKRSVIILLLLLPFKKLNFRWLLGDIVLHTLARST